MNHNIKRKECSQDKYPKLIQTGHKIMQEVKIIRKKEES